MWAGWVWARQMAWPAAWDGAHSSAWDLPAHSGGRGLRAQNPATGPAWLSGAAQIPGDSGSAFCGHIPKCPFCRPVLPDTPSAGLAGPLQAGEGLLLSEQIALRRFRGFKLIKELFLAFISLYLPAIYMLMQALPPRMRGGVSSRRLITQENSGK